MAFLQPASFRLHSKIALALVAALCVLGGCSKKVDDRKVVFVDTTTEAMDVMTKARGTFGLRGPPRSMWLDPRSEAEFAQGHIPGAVNLPFPRIEAEHEVVLKDVDVIMVYDNDYDDALVKAVAKRLISLGHKDVQVLRGGLKAWKRDGQSIATGGGPAANSASARQAGS